jgi:crotonobetainyl-CoA:carnitine CoA-transferase CaiB-like acyl-CoA transferase
VAALGAIATVDDEELGPIRMTNVLTRLSETPGEICWTGRRHGVDTAAVLAEIGVTGDELERLREAGVV